MAERYRVQLTTAALADLDAIGDYMAQVRGLDAAEALIDRLQERVAGLDGLPLRGPVPKELDGLGRSDVRQVVFGRHRIFYRVVGHDVNVFMFVDGRRDIDLLLAQRLREVSPG